MRDYSLAQQEKSNLSDSSPLAMHETLSAPAVIAIKDANNPRIFAGTFVHSGKGKMLVCLVGRNTR